MFIKSVIIYSLVRFFVFCLPLQAIRELEGIWSTNSLNKQQGQGLNHVVIYQQRVFNAQFLPLPPTGCELHNSKAQLTSKTLWSLQLGRVQPFFPWPMALLLNLELCSQPCLPLESSKGLLKSWCPGHAPDQLLWNLCSGLWHLHFPGDSEIRLRRPPSGRSEREIPNTEGGMPT